MPRVCSTPQKFQGAFVVLPTEISGYRESFSSCLASLAFTNCELQRRPFLCLQMGEPPPSQPEHWSAVFAPLCLCYSHANEGYRTHAGSFPYYVNKTFSPSITEKLLLILKGTGVTVGNGSKLFFLPTCFIRLNLVLMWTERTGVSLSPEHLSSSGPSAFSQLPSKSSVCT